SNATQLDTSGSGTLAAAMTGDSITNAYYGALNYNNPVNMGLSAPSGSSTIEVVYTGFNGAAGVWHSVDVFDSDGSQCEYKLTNSDLLTLSTGNGGLFQVPF